VDNGHGVPRALLDKIFEPFVTTKEPGKGTGLGLAVCERLVESMGGSIRAESEEGAGASFMVLLPAVTVPLEALRGA
jgi:signal transduction histidine kinase